MTNANLLEHKPLVDDFLQRQKVSLSSFSFVNIFAWKEYFRFELKMINDSLCVFAFHDMGCFLYLPPLGKDLSRETIEECFYIMENANEGCGVTRIENVHEYQLDFFPKEQFRHYKKGYEYLYYRQDIARLKGNAYKSKRSSFNQCGKNYSCQMLPYALDMQAACLSLYDLWSGQRKNKYQNEIYQQMLTDSSVVLKEILGNLKELGMIGRVMAVDGQVKAFTIGYELNPQIFCVLFEVTDLNVKGLAVRIFSEFCDDPEIRKYSFINAMDDFELANIAKTKMSFHPVALYPSFTVTKNK